jgi:ornithine carbamoyltransferase
MKNLVTIKDLNNKNIEQIFAYARDAGSLEANRSARLTAACSFGTRSIRTRATFMKALHDLGIQPIEIPGLLATGEDVSHLTGYLDNWFDLYVIRETDHDRLASFAECSTKPVVNAMTSRFHPCEVLSDAYSIENAKGPLTGLKYCMIGPPSNVFNSWHNLAGVLNLSLVHVLPKRYESHRPESKSTIVTSDKYEGLEGADVILTDAWPADFHDDYFQLKLEDLGVANDRAWVIPCPPFDTGREIAKAVIDSAYFPGYGQKALLYDVHKAIVFYCMTR